MALARHEQRQEPKLLGALVQHVVFIRTGLVVSQDDVLVALEFQLEEQSRREGLGSDLVVELALLVEPLLESLVHRIERS